MKYARVIRCIFRNVLENICVIVGILSFFSPQMAVAVKRDAVLPLVAIVFDDAHRSFPYAVERMHQAGLVGTVYVPTRLVGRYDFHTTWQDIEKARDIGWEIANHTATHVDLTKIPLTSVVDEITQSTRDLESHGITATSFAAPYGEQNEDIRKVVMTRFQTNRMAWGEVVIVPENLNVRALPVFDLSHVGTTYSAMEAVLQRAITDRGLVIIVYHKIVMDGRADVIDKFTVKRDDFDAFLRKVSELRTKGEIRSVTVSEGIQEIAGRNRQKD